MKVKPLYRYEWAEGKIEISPVMPENKPYTDKYRLIADEGMILTHNGETVGEVIDTDTLDGWAEVEKPEEY